MKKLLKILILFLGISLFGSDIKTPSDVYSYGIMLKQKVQFLREQEGITKPFPKVEIQKNRYPRHVIQKALEILSKINLYRVSKDYGEIFIPPYPARDITPSDVYDIVKRLDEEVTPLVSNKKFLYSVKEEHFKGKNPNDVYGLLWSISLAFDSLLGIHGYTPTDVYNLSEKLLKTVKYLAESQNIYSKIEKPKLVADLHPNHALYKSYSLLDKISKAQNKLWITPTEVPAKPSKVITPTDVYDAMQYNIAELQRIKYRLGLERYFKLTKSKKTKNPSDVVQNIKYAIALFPEFNLDKKLVQYPTKSLQKTPNDVFAVTQNILTKITKLKNSRGIMQHPQEPPYIYGLKPSHTYQKALEATEKSIKLKTQVGFFPSQIPTSPLREITPNEVYELVLRLDGITTFLLKKAGRTSEEYIYRLDKEVYTNKNPDDVYNNLWKISNELDVLLASEYSPNETFQMATVIEAKIKLIRKKINLTEKSKQYAKESLEVNKTPKDVFEITLDLFESIKRIQKRLNMETGNIIIPVEKNITPNTVYNALRILNASINEIIIYLNVEDGLGFREIDAELKDKTPTDVFIKLKHIQTDLNDMFKDQNYAR